ncbi:MAG: PH domain-containing protein [Candidatus Bathyarchaeia archaeon]
MLFTLLFIVIGIGVILTPLLVEFLRYRNTEYMITNQRVVTQTGAIGMDTRFVKLNNVQEVYVT